MFVLLLLALLVASAVHVSMTGRRSASTAGEVVLLYLLVGYCGLPMLAVSAVSLLRPDAVADWLGLPIGDPFQQFMSVAYLGMSVVATLALWYRGHYLIAPAVCWAVFFAGATVVHLDHYGEQGGLGHGELLHTFATHGLISLLLLGSLLATDLLRERA